MSTLRQAWKTMTDGTTRTLKWVAGGMRSSSKDETPEAATTAAPVQTATAEKGFGERLEQRSGHSPRTIGLAIGVGAIVLMWIGWTAYVWSENGSTAGIGVLISWPAVLAAVTLVTAPFIGGAVAVRRHRAGEPVLAGAFAPAESPAAPAPETEADETDETDETEPEGSADDEPDSDEDDSEDDDDPDDGDEPDPVEKDS